MLPAPGVYAGDAISELAFSVAQLTLPSKVAIGLCTSKAGAVTSMELLASISIWPPALIHAS